MEILRKGYFFSRKKNPPPHAHVFHFISVPHYRESGRRVLSSPSVSGSQRVLQPPHIEQDPSKQNHHKSFSQFLMPSLGPSRSNKGSMLAVPFHSWRDIRPAGWSDATVTSIAATTQGRGLFRNLGF